MKIKLSIYDFAESTVVRVYGKYGDPEALSLPWLLLFNAALSVSHYYYFMNNLISYLEVRHLLDY